MNADTGLRSLIVIPTYKEAANITELLRQVVEHNPSVDVLVVDDESPDGTADLVDEFGREHPGVSVMRRTVRDGLGGAYRAGLAYALEPERGYDAVVHMDADFSHPPAMVPTLLDALRNGADLAMASRYVPGGAVVNWPLRRQLLSKWGNRYSRAILGVRIRDITCGFRAFRSDALRRVDPSSTGADGYVFHTEMSLRSSDAGLKIVELPVRFVDRERGESKMNASIIIESMLTVTRIGLRRRAASVRRLVTRRRG
jgi:dolichol-phosphate mannosyltransferase